MSFLPEYRYPPENNTQAGGSDTQCHPTGRREMDVLQVNAGLIRAFVNVVHFRCHDNCCRMLISLFNEGGDKGN
jgi:hypothetical protein